MTETQRRIKIYKQALPHLKERVTAVALLLAISVAMVASASFAWVTLSAAPEVNGLATTVSTNGNLEIALSGADGVAPPESAVGDGAGKITETNLKWGNLINLSHEDYGLEYLTLRPATLESSKLLSSPLKSVTYGEDGRISGTISNFAYTNFKKLENGKGEFFVPEDGLDYGVRAISSVTYNSVSGDAMLISLANSVETNRVRAEVEFTKLYRTDKYMNAITGLAGVYLQYRLDDVDQDCTQYVEPVYEMMNAYIICMDYIGQSLLSAANLHHFVYCNKNKQTFTAFDLDDIKDGTAQTILAQEQITLDSMSYYRNMVEKFYGSDKTEGAYPRIKEAYDNKRYMGWVEMSKSVNVMANILTTTVNGVAASQLDKDTLLGMIGGVLGSKAQKVVIQSGLIVDTEKLLGTGLEVNGLSMKVMGIGVKADVTCNVSAPYYLVEDAAKAQQKASEGGLVASDAVAADTYGMALDFWLRTNAANSKLKLEGKLIYETRDKIGPDGQPERDENGNIKKERVVVGYSGANRIWEENDPGLPEIGTSTSQGTGSCYVFYPSSDADRIQSLNLLRAMCVAFVSEDGRLLAEAELDTENAIGNYGRVLVPLLLKEETLKQIDPETGEEVEVEKDYITEMVQNEATRVTALIYLDGSMLTNSEVLAASSINGHLNIQFCTDEDIASINRPDLKDDYYEVAVTATSETRFNSFNPNDKPKVSLQLELSGMEADTITGNFVSFISETQGTRQPTFSFEHVGGKIWKAEVTFHSAGNFELRSVQIDGVDCMLDEKQVTRVEIKGVAVRDVICPTWSKPSSFSLMTANTYYPLEIEMDLSIGEGIRNPSEVLAVFTHDGGQNVTLSFSPRSSTKWVARGNFTASGRYTLNYVLIDGATVALTGSQVKVLDLTLGVEVKTFLRQPVDEGYLELVEEMNAALKQASEDEYESVKADYENQLEEHLENLYVGNPEDDKDALELISTPNGYRFFHDGSKTLFMDVSCIIVNDKDEPITGLNGTWLYYAIGGNVQGRLSSRVQWNSITQSYEGRFEVEAPGTYSFQYLTIPTEAGAEPMYITSSPDAPKIQATSPKPIAYKGKSDYHSVDSMVEIMPNANRWVGFVLSDAASAEAIITMRHTDKAASMEAYRAALGLSETTVITDNKDGTYSYELTKEASKVNDEKEGEYFYFVDYPKGDTAVGLPHDGKWQIVDFKIYNAFYGHTFYDGVAPENGGTGYLTPKELVLNLNKEDKIESTFFTTVNFNLSDTLPTAATKQFMDPYYNKAVTFKVTDYLGNPINGVGVHLSYTWDENLQSKYKALNKEDIPTTMKNLGGDLTAGADGSFTTGVLSFYLSGTYTCKFSVTYNGEEYDVSKFTMGGKELVVSDVMVTWELPELEITGVTGATLGSVDNTTFTVKLDNDGGDFNWSQFNGAQNYFERYYANLYIESTGVNNHVIPSVTMKLHDFGNASAQVVVTNGSDASRSSTYSFTAAKNEDVQEVGAKKPGDNASWRSYRLPIGNQTVKEATFTYEGLKFTAELSTPVVINQQRAPAYVDINYDSDYFGTISGLDVTSFSGKTYTVPGAAKTIRIISPDGRAFKVFLPKLTREVYGRAEDDPNTTTEYDNENGTAAGTYVYYQYTVTETQGCDNVEVTYYKQYEKYVRTARKVGTRSIYNDIYSVEKWGNYSSDSQATITETTTLTAAAPTHTAVFQRKENLNSQPIKQYIYKAVAGKEKMSSMDPAGDYFASEALIPTTEWLDEVQ